MIDITIIDDALPLSLADDLENLILNNDRYLWSFLPDITYGNHKGKGSVIIPGFQHLYFNSEHGIISYNYFGYIHSIPVLYLIKLAIKKDHK